MSFSFTTEQFPTHLLIRLKGNLLSSYESKPLLEKLIHNGPETVRIIIDLGELKFMNSEGFNTLLKILTFARNHGGDVVVINLSTELNQLFIISKLNSIFTCYNDIDTAIKKLIG